MQPQADVLTYKDSGQVIHIRYDPGVKSTQNSFPSVGVKAQTLLKPHNPMKTFQIAQSENISSDELILHWASALLQYIGCSAL